MADDKTRPQTINEEAGLGSNWVPVDVSPIIPGQAPPGMPVSRTPTNLQGSLPPGFQHDTSFVSTEYDSPNVPKFSIMPLGIQGNPQTNSAIQSTAIKAVSAGTAAAPAGDIEEIAVNKQTGTSYAVQGTDNDTLISMSNNAGGTVILPSSSSSVLTSSMAYVQSKTNDNAVATTCDTTFTGAVVSGNTVVVIAGGSALDSGTDVPVTTVVDNKGNMYTRLDNQVVFATGSTQRWNVSIWVATNVTGGASFKVTATIGMANFTLLSVLEYTPSTIFTLDAVTTLSNGGPSTATTGTATVTGSSDMLFGVSVGQTSNTSVVWAAGAGYTLRENFWENTLGDLSIGVEDQKTTSAGLYSATMTESGTAINFALILWAIKIVQSTSGFSPPSGFYCWVENTGSGTFVVSSAAQIDGVAQTVSLGQNQGALFVFDGFNWYTERGIGTALPITPANGGTGRTSLTAHNVLLGEGTSPVGFAPPVSAGFILTDNGVGFDPTFQAPPSTGLSAVMKVNGTGVAADKQVYINGVTDGASVWGVSINGTPDGG